MLCVCLHCWGVLYMDYAYVIYCMYAVCVCYVLCVFSLCVLYVMYVLFEYIVYVVLYAYSVWYLRAV